MTMKITNKKIILEKLKLLKDKMAAYPKQKGEELFQTLCSGYVSEDTYVVEYMIKALQDKKKSDYLNTVLEEWLMDCNTVWKHINKNT